jgi:hypothetical protein
MAKCPCSDKPPKKVMMDGYGDVDDEVYERGEKKNLFFSVLERGSKRRKDFFVVLVGLFFDFDTKK